MALDRQTIEKKDFPVSRRGYDIDAVDAHLRLLSEQVEDLKRSSRRGQESLASAASGQVQAIVGAAEAAAAEIRADIEREVEQIRREARVEAKAAREEAVAEAGQYISKVSESTAAMRQRVEALDGELGSVVESLREAGRRLASQLDGLDGELDEVRSAVQRRSGEVSPAAAAQPPAPEPDYDDEYADDDELYEDAAPEAAEAAEAAETLAVEAPEVAPAAELPVEQGPPVSVPPPSGGGQDDEVEGARIIALNMAMNNASREEVDEYLAENFSLSDRKTLIEDVYAAFED